MTGSSLLDIPGVGKNMAEHLESLGIFRIEDLRGHDPQEMYDRDCAMHGYQDRCVLYVYRCAVYFAQTPNPDPEKRKWWNWKDGCVEPKE